MRVRVYVCMCVCVYMNGENYKRAWACLAYRTKLLGGLHSRTRSKMTADAPTHMMHRVLNRMHPAQAVSNCVYP